MDDVAAQLGQLEIVVTAALAKQGERFVNGDPVLPGDDARGLLSTRVLDRAALVVVRGELGGGAARRTDARLTTLRSDRSLQRVG